MSNPNKARGTAWESAVRDYLNGYLGLYVEGWRQLPPGITKFRNPADPLNIKRQAQEGIHDVGDLHAWPFIVECKDVKNPAVPTWLRQAEVEAANAGFPYGVAVHKERGSGVFHGQVHFGVRAWTRVRLQLGMKAQDFADSYGFTATLRGRNTGRWYLTTSVGDFALLLADIRNSPYIPRERPATASTRAETDM